MKIKEEVFCLVSNIAKVWKLHVCSKNQIVFIHVFVFNVYWEYRNSAFLLNSEVNFFIPSFLVNKMLPKSPPLSLGLTSVADIEVAERPGRLRHCRWFMSQFMAEYLNAGVMNGNSWSVINGYSAGNRC